MQKETNMFEVERQEMNSKREPVQSFPQLERSSSDDESSSLMGETTQRPRETSRHNTNSEEISIQSGSTINIDKQALEDIIARSKDRSGVFVARSIDLFLLLLAFLSILVVALLRGGHGVESIIGLQTCSLKSMGLLVLVQIFCFSISLINYKRHKLELLGKETLSDFEENSMLNKSTRIETSHSADLLLHIWDGSWTLGNWRWHDHQPYNDRFRVSG